LYNIANSGDASAAAARPRKSELTSISAIIHDSLVDEGEIIAENKE